MVLQMFAFIIRSTFSLKTKFISELQFTMIFIFLDIAIPNTDAT